jgi:anaerobic ribonucleoside-triphosphate reductase activating protein
MWYNPDMKIASTQYNLDKEALEIYVSGCTFNCHDCHNPELQDFNVGTNLQNAWESIEKKIINNPDLIKRVWVLGGEPLQQDDILYMLQFLRDIKMEIWLFTGYELEQIGAHIKAKCDYIKCGIYDDTKLVDDKVQYGVKLPSDNQHVYRKGWDY